jgi:Dockerin type I domain
VPITVTLRNSTGWCDVNHDGAVNNTDLQLVEAAVGTNNTMPNFNYRYDLNRDGVVDAADVTLMQACVIAATRTIYLPSALKQ